MASKTEAQEGTIVTAVPVEADGTRQKPRQLTRKQQNFVKELVENPHSNATQAYIKAYDTKGMKRETINREASRTTSLPQVKTELAKYSTEVENTLYRAVTDWGTHDRPRQREIALDAAKYIHDKIHGRATQKVETTSEAVVINVDMTHSKPV